MIAVSNDWKEINKRQLLPETFVEITVGISDSGVKDLLTAQGLNEAAFSDANAVIGNVIVTETKYATLEHNLWVLDGSQNIAPSNTPFFSPGYVNDNGLEAGITLSSSEVRTMLIPGFTITWSSEHGDYATDFTVEVKNGDTIIGSATVTGNTTNVTEVELLVSDYDSVTVTVTGWSHPDRRVRIDRINFGYSVAFGKKDIISYTHEQQGCLNSGEIPKNSISFALDNTDGKWNPYNPNGIGRFLMERQTVTARYGLNVNGVTEWINAGKFYLSDWKAPANGLEATFIARDAFEFLLNSNAATPLTGTLSELIGQTMQADFPLDVAVNIDPSLDDYSVTYSEKNTEAEVIQKCANAACCVIRCDRDGNVNIEPLKKEMQDYMVTAKLSYAHPEITLSKVMKEVSVSYGEDSRYVLSVGANGEIQTVDNPFITSQAQAANVAEWVKETLESRKTVTGEFRADPRLDLFDIISVESKYGTITPVAITNIKYSYSGSFRGSYTGKVISGISTDVLGEFVLGTSKLGG